MTDIFQRTKAFQAQCAEEVVKGFPDYGRYDLLNYTIIQLTAVVFKLEERIKELESERV